MRTASGIVNGRGRFIAGVVLLTAGYSAEGKYSHYLIVQTPIRIGGVKLKPGEYVFGWTRAHAGDELSVHFYIAATGALVGTAEARGKSPHLASRRQGIDSDWPLRHSLRVDAVGPASGPKSPSSS